MLTTPYLNLSSFFYPIGNTTAVCLTQDLSPEQKANVLLLGCGDARNILFTCYSQIPQNNRKIDVTCCDFQKAVIARNMVLFTLLVDDTSGLNDDAIFDIYYHFKLDDKSIKMLQSQTEKLCRLASSMESWDESAYGTLLRFCDERSLAIVREVWSFYNKASPSDSFNSTFEAKLRQSSGWKQRHMGPTGEGLVATGIRSAAPVAIEAMNELPQFHEHYWKHGITEGSTSKTSGAKFANPMFATMDTSEIIHYGTDPLLGFHLATAYLPLSLKSPLRPKFDLNATRCRAVHAARAQFRVWATAFRKLARQNLTLRFVVGDALAFCHTLQHNAERANWYCGQYNLKPFILDGKDYKNGNAPRTFNAIDTSNLADHVGIVNILVATTPLLERSPWSSIYTELLVKQEDDQQALTQNLLCGHFATMSTVFGLFPVEFFSNATAISNADQAIMDALSKGGPGQQLHRLAWKCSSPCSAIQGDGPELDQLLHFHEEDLAHLLHHVYSVMFRHENIARQLNVREYLKSQLIFYTRASFASLLRYVKNVSKVRWDEMMALLLRLIEQDTRSIIEAHYYQELYAHLHLLGLAQLHTLGMDYPLFFDKSNVFPSDVKNTPSSVSKGLGAWKDIPPVVCITLSVPRANLQVITNIPVHQLGTPLVHSAIQGSSTIGGWHNIFCGLQLSFARKISTSGDRNGDDFELQIEEDALNWKGTSPLLVSFYVPSNVLLQEPIAARIYFGFQATPHNLNLFLKKLGMEMRLYETHLGDQEHVFITKYLPNQRGYTSICRSMAEGVESREDEKKSLRTTTTASVSHSTGRITTFTGRIDFISEALKSTLAEKAAVVKTDQLSPRTIQISIGKNSKHLLHFPTPVLNSRAKTRIARKSSYIEIIVPMADHTEGTGYPNFMFPLVATESEPVSWNMPFLNLDSLPVIDVTKREGLQWLTPHTSLQMSARERRSREHNMATPGHVQKDVRINLKDSIFSMFMTFTGLQSAQRMRIQALHHPDSGINLIILISDLKLALGNQTAILDAAVLPLTVDLLPRIRNFLISFNNLQKHVIKVDDEELALWKEVLPAFIERCRTWKHLPTCSYKTKSKIPLSTAHAEPFLCSCGNGSVPPDFIKDIPHFNTISKYAVRAAISPIYAVPFVEKMVSFDDAKTGEKSREGKESDGGVERCGTCERTRHVKGGELAACSRCRGVKYCSVECQKVDWKAHKRVCVKAAEEVGGNAGDGGKNDAKLDELVDAMRAEGLD